MPAILYAFASVCLEECLDLGVFSFPMAILYAVGFFSSSSLFCFWAVEEFSEA
jgi:hypothetical protein